MNIAYITTENVSMAPPTSGVVNHLDEPAKELYDNLDCPQKFDDSSSSSGYTTFGSSIIKSYAEELSDPLTVNMTPASPAERSMPSFSAAQSKEFTEELFEHSKYGNLDCPKCGEIYTSRYSLMDHVRLEHHTGKQRNAYPVQHIIQKLKNNKDLESETSHFNPFYVCGLCDYKIKSKNIWYEHLKIHIPKKFDDLSSSRGDKTYGSSVNLKDCHTKIHAKELSDRSTVTAIKTTVTSTVTTGPAVASTRAERVSHFSNIPRLLNNQSNESIGGAYNNSSLRFRSAPQYFDIKNSKIQEYQPGCKKQKFLCKVPSCDKKCSEQFELQVHNHGEPSNRPTWNNLLHTHESKKIHTKERLYQSSVSAVNSTVAASVNNGGALAAKYSTSMEQDSCGSNTPGLLNSELNKSIKEVDNNLPICPKRDPIFCVDCKSYYEMEHFRDQKCKPYSRKRKF